MLATATTLLSACKANTTTDTTAAVTTAADATAALTEDSGTAAATTAAVVIPVVLPSVASGTMTINGETVSAAEYDFYYYTIYSNYAQYASYGAVPTSAADGKFDLTAACTLEGYETQTWGDYIKASALKQLQDTYILASYATDAGLALTASDQSTIDSFYTSVQTYADTASMTLDEYLTTMYGDQCSKAALDSVISRYLLAGGYMSSLEKAYTFTDEEMQTFYTANKDSYENTDLPVVRHILFLAPTAADGYTDATADELAAAKALAESTLASIKSYEDMVTIGDADFTAGTAYESAEYTVAAGAMTATFEDWSYDAARKPGDTGIVQSEYGYHVMYFVKTQKDWTEDAISSLTSDKYNAYIAEQEALPQFVLTAS